MSDSRIKSRRGHTKSRLGCAACKRRHQKCDENRPSCINCTTAQRRCPYLGDVTGSETSTPSDEVAPSQQALNSSHRDGGDAVVPVELTLNNVSAELLYVELLQHWLLHTYHACVGPRSVADRFGPIALNRALNSPYLMRSMLALAALHKASGSGPGQSKYLALSDQLQAEGLIKFTSIIQNINADTIISAFLFAFVTGTHRLCYTLSQAKQQTNFLDTLIDSMTFLKGIQTIITGWWPHIKSSELQILLPVNDFSDVAEGRFKTAENLSYLKGLINISGLDPDTSTVYNTALEGLRAAYNDLGALSGPDTDASVGFVVVWMITIPSEFIQFVQERRPPALAILGHAAPLFHNRRHFWGIGDAGQVLLSAIGSELPDEWQSWLDWPRGAVGAV